MTETSPVIAVNALGKGETMVGTVGRPLENLSVKIADDGEISVKGPSIMKGYYNKPDLTADVINYDGYFHTGDIGFLASAQPLHIDKFDRNKTKESLIQQALGKMHIDNPNYSDQV